MKHQHGPLAALFCALVLAACSGPAELNGHDITGVMPALQYELINEQDRTVEAGAHAGTIRLMFFGYTHCPDICPITLGRIKAALSAFPPEERSAFRVLFVSVDPQRDTPERLREYTAYFGEQVIGMTGSQAQLQALSRRYRVTYGYGDKNESGFYEVSHSGGVFVFDREGRARLLFNQSIGPQAMAHDLRTLL